MLILCIVKGRLLSLQIDKNMNVYVGVDPTATMFSQRYISRIIAPPVGGNNNYGSVCEAR